LRMRPLSGACCNRHSATRSKCFRSRQPPKPPEEVEVRGRTETHLSSSATNRGVGGAASFRPDRRRLRSARLPLPAGGCPIIGALSVQPVELNECPFREMETERAARLGARGEWSRGDGSRLLCQAGC
jgi:hypothetical protein